MHLVTGATGLTGSHLLLALCRRGDAVRALKRPGSDLGPVRRLFGDEAALLERVEWTDGDVLDVQVLSEAMQGVSRVYHCAAFVSFVPSEVPAMLRTNIEGTANVVNACLDARVDKLCHMSSVAAINRIDENEVIHEEIPWKISPENSNYAISKYGAEREVWRGMAEGLEAVIVNPSIIIGPGDWHRSSDAIFLKVWNGLKYYTEGVTGWVDVRDVVRCMLDLMDGGLSGQRFIVSAENLPFRTVFDWAAEFLGRPKPWFLANRPVRGLVWRVEAVKSCLFNMRPLITRETARTAGKSVRFSNARIKAATGIEFTPVREAVRYTCEALLREKAERASVPVA